MIVYVVVNGNREPLKGSAYSAHTGRVRAYTKLSSARSSKSQTPGAEEVVEYVPLARVEAAFAAGANWAADEVSGCCGCGGPSDSVIAAEAARYAEEGK